VAKKPRYRSLASKFSIFTGSLVFWVVAVTMSYDLRQDNFGVSKGVLLFLVVVLVAGAIARMTIRLLARPLSLLQAGITNVREGRLEPIQISRTGDEIEFLGDSFNKMIEALASTQKELLQNQEMLEDRIKQRTQQLEIAMQKALAASQAKSEFLANISHELRTPMNGILGMMDLVLSSPLSPEQQDQMETAQGCAYSLLALLNDLLDLSKIEAGRMVLDKVPFNPRMLLEDAVKTQQASAAQRGVVLRTQIASNVPDQILGDPLRLRQILANLLSHVGGVYYAAGRRAFGSGRGESHFADSGDRYRDGDSARQAEHDLRKIHAGRQQHQSQVRRHWAWSCDYADPGCDARRTDQRRERSGQGQQVHTHAAVRRCAAIEATP
jgi:signal transduction histidine kinase